MVVVLATLFLGAPVTFFVGYLLLMLVAAITPIPCRTGARAEHFGDIAVVIPAHDEEPVISATLASVFAQSQPPAAVYVIADNCTDRTAALARAAGATVLERTDPEKRGKGWALAWAFERLLNETDFDAFVILDADTHAASDFCAAISRRLAELGPGEKVAFQGRYGVLNESDGWRAALMSAAFALVNHVRLSGADRFGGFVGLKGNGMAFSRTLLIAHPWSGASITEDLDYALDLDRAGVRIRYVPEAKVAAQMPVDHRAASTQRRRWENGRTQLARARALGALQAGRVWAALDLLTPPLGELCGLLLLWGLLTPFCPLGMALWWAGAAAGLLFYVLGGLLVSGASRRVWLALVCAPFYIAWKLAQRLARPSREWVRTERIQP